MIGIQAMTYLNLLFRGYRKLKKETLRLYSTQVTKILFKLNGVSIPRNFCSNGVPMINNAGRMEVGNSFKINNGNYFNKIGRQGVCIFNVGESGFLHIGKNVGMSSTAIVCRERIRIGDDVLIGGNTVIYDTDFHSKNPETRKGIKNNSNNSKRKEEVIIGDNVFIGAHTTILKGVHIGKNSLIGAGAVVTRNIPSNEIWAGNPASFIKDIPY